MKTLIINLGPTGDIVRSTILLSEIKGEIYWLSKRTYSDVLKSNKIKKVFYLDKKEDISEINLFDFDLVINLNEDEKALDFLDKINYSKLEGVFRENGRINYTPNSADWFNMSLISKYGKEKADDLKLKNRSIFQKLILKFIGKNFKGQKYDIGILPKKINVNVIGIIREINGLWPNKGWEYYGKLKQLLEKEGFKVKFLGMREKFSQHIENINDCGTIICGDTAGMHIALALEKKIIALFNCTSPWEIYDYGRLKKIISPKLNKYFYKKTDDLEARKAISLKEVYSTVKEVLKE